MERDFLEHRFGIYIHPINNNCLGVEIGDLTVYFSYRTPIAFKIKPKKKYICENIWGKTTEKHMAYIKAGQTNTIELKRDDFKEKLKTSFRQNFIVCARDLLKERFGLKTETIESSDGVRQNLEKSEE